jgi:hypothetical protein
MDAINAKEGSSSETGTPEVNASSENAVPTPAREQAPLAVKRNADQKAPSVGLGGVTTLIRKSGGPSTKQGKEKSRRNAVKHGIFARVVLLDNESAPQFDGLLQGFRNDLRPEGTLEEVLVEKLAALMWRYRRMLVAERAEIRVEQRFSSPKAERDRLHREETLELETATNFSNRGLLGDCRNPVSVESGVELLKKLKQFIGVRGFKPDEDSQLIARVFGLINFPNYKTMYDLHNDPAKVLRDKELKGFALPLAGRQAKYCEHLQTLIKKFEHFGKLFKDIANTRERIEAKAANVPEAPRLDRILRYSAGLERDSDRTLNQLERLQRTRRGQPATPTLNVNISG